MNDLFYNQKGFTLIETVVALVLVLLLVTAFSGAMTVGLQREVETDNSLKASSLASSIIEDLGENKIKVNIIEDEYSDEIRLIDFYSLINDYNKDLEEDEQIQVDDFIIDDLTFSDLNKDKSNIKIVNDNFDDIETLYKIKIEIVWNERGFERTTNLVSLLYLG